MHIRSFSKSHGPDLRLAAVGGAGDIVTAVANRRLLGPGWSSRILQAVLVEMLVRPTTADVLGTRRGEYARRRRVVADVLAAAPCRSRATGSTCGCASATNAPRCLAAQGIGAAPGEPFLVRPDADSLRLTVGLLSGSDDEIRSTARLIANTAGLTPARSGQR